MTTSKEELETVVVTGEEVDTVINKMVEFFRKEKFPELVAYVAMREIMEGIAAANDIRGCIEHQMHPGNGEIN